MRSKKEQEHQSLAGIWTHVRNRQHESGYVRDFSKSSVEGSQRMIVHAMSIGLMSWLHLHRWLRTRHTDTPHLASTGEARERNVTMSVSIGSSMQEPEGRWKVNMNPANTFTNQQLRLQQATLLFFSSDYLLHTAKKRKPWPFLTSARITRKYQKPPINKWSATNPLSFTKVIV